MIARVVGTLSILAGIIWIVWPGILRWWFLRKTNGAFFWLAAGVLFYPLFHLGKRGGIVGLLLVFIVFWVAMGRVRAMTGDVFQKIPVGAYRLIGLVNIIAGVALFYKS
jgi:hypothetical protein